MSAGKYTTSILQGATFQRDITWTDNTNNTPIDLTGSIVRLQARKRLTSDTTVLDLSTATSGITITDALNGQFQILLTAAETAALDFATAVYDLEVEFPSGEIRRVLEGTLELKKEVTR